MWLPLSTTSTLPKDSNRRRNILKMNLPVDFDQLAKSAGSASLGGYPYRIKGSDLMKNFVYCNIDGDPTIIENIIGQSGHPSRRLKIPTVPPTGTHILGAVDGILQWLATEEC